MLKTVLLAVVLVASVEAWMHPGGCMSPPHPGEISPLARLYYDQYCESLMYGTGTPHLLNKRTFVPMEGGSTNCRNLLSKEICDEYDRVRTRYGPPNGRDECLWVEC
ncbi:hypothetical protein QR680_013767 [Steinernema hermaphroditum]|uniref:Uncharacterized protein n=1 Tax=Steinernema hermaphroditum TaxID=289476 RepID=A0AA39M319_9BILA|nr:hypothetical protein QR680_013767 [Steinernema hermaphroditum]